MNERTASPRIINCHAHVFTGFHVPPYLAKTFLPWPFYYLVPLSGLLRLFSWWYHKGPYTWQFKSWYKKLAQASYKTKIYFVRHPLLGRLKDVAGILVTIQVFYVFYDLIRRLQSPGKGTAKTVSAVRDWLSRHYLYYPKTGFWTKLLLVIVLLLFFQWGRNLIIFIFRQFWSFLGKIPGKQSLELIGRYFNIARFCVYKNQSGIFSKLNSQYPPGTGFILLPMDMAFMDAGPVQEDYAAQHEQLASLKRNHPDTAFPFLFIDPRRIPDDPAGFFTYTQEKGAVTLGDCFVKKYIEDEAFSGFKIYPALGYYPFDERLLPLWKYAADNGIPITTHCIRGTIFYRGSKKKDWDRHPVFEQAVGDQEYSPLLLPQMENRDFINNFTHPLNYLVLLDEEILRKVVAKAGDPVKALFGFKDEQTPMEYDLRHLKLCLGHFGGDDEWKKFMERDRDNFSSQLVKRPDFGIDFFNPQDGVRKKGILEQVWKYADWYTIACSLMLQYDNIYADISYILHDDSILPLLKETLQNASLKQKVLYGTDFYVVRNYKSDKNMLADMMAGLSDDEFNLIARTNPCQFLARTQA